MLNRISFLRLFIFVVSAIILLYLFSSNLLAPVFVVFPLMIACFVVAIKYYNKIAFKKRHTTNLKIINESELLREKCKLDSFENGELFTNHEHPYTSDLDIFGQYSNLQLLNRATTESGRHCLSEWLSKPASNNEILERQTAVKELSRKLDWRQNFLASGMHYINKKSDFTKLLKWTDAAVVVIKHRLVYITVSIMLSILSVLSLYFWAVNVLSPNQGGYFLAFFTVLWLSRHKGA